MRLKYSSRPGTRVEFSIPYYESTYWVWSKNAAPISFFSAKKKKIWVTLFSPVECIIFELFVINKRSWLFFLWNREPYFWTRVTIFFICLWNLLLVTFLIIKNIKPAFREAVSLNLIGLPKKKLRYNINLLPTIQTA
jgi:hypothetical protein